MNARTRIKQEIAQLADGLKSRRPLADDLRSLDAVLIEIADCIKYNTERNNHGPVNKQLRSIEKTLEALGYVPEDKQVKAIHAPWCNASYGNTRMSADGEREFQSPCNCGGSWNS